MAGRQTDLLSPLWGHFFAVGSSIQTDPGTVWFRADRWQFGVLTFHFCSFCIFDLTCQTPDLAIKQGLSQGYSHLFPAVIFKLCVFAIFNALVVVFLFVLLFLSG